MFCLLEVWLESGDVYLMSCLLKVRSCQDLNRRWISISFSPTSNSANRKSSHGFSPEGEMFLVSPFNGVLMVHTKWLLNSQFSVLDIVSTSVFAMQIEPMYTKKCPTWKWTVSIYRYIYHLSSALMPELSWYDQHSVDAGSNHNWISSIARPRPTWAGNMALGPGNWVLIACWGAVYNRAITHSAGCK